ncbi:hypothetical protein V1520DRAFT_283565 [Lipomyces starkeyi]|uniref:Uncharacterized protein n=1 Tax=Lipomyces starkeyi NRRL Y-11557 TaxID=675824 RepID=A0A1E3Q296_LIPST|nr:hypothetical protein LIPSTDRAFT_5006 [Lipomyces starkeyi NRRL Y-11557]
MRKRFRISRTDQQQSDNETARIETRDTFLAQVDRDVNDEDDDRFLDEDSVIEEDMHVEAEGCPIFRKPARNSSILYVQEGPKEVYEDGRRNLRRNVSMGLLSNYNFTVASDANVSARISKGRSTNHRHSLQELVAKVESCMKENMSKTEMNQRTVLLALGYRGPYICIKGTIASSESSESSALSSQEVISLDDGIGYSANKSYECKEGSVEGQFGKRVRRMEYDDSEGNEAGDNNQTQGLI